MGATSEEKIPLCPREEDISKKINFVPTVFIFITLCFGAAVMVLPYTIMQSGLVGWLIITAVICLVGGYASYLQTLNSNRMLDSLDNTIVHIRNPHAHLSFLALGRPFKAATVFLFTTTSLSLVTSLILLAATLLKDTISIPHLGTFTQIRIWVLVVCIFVTPFLYLGYFRDDLAVAYFGFATSALSVLTILIATGLEWNTVPYTKTPDVDFGSVVTAIGTMINCLTGFSIVIPNLAGEAKSPSRLGLSSTIAYIILFIIYITNGLVPFSLYGGSSEEVVFATISKNAHHTTAILVLVVIGKTFMALHILTAIVLYMNPPLQQIELALNVPVEFTWKRVGVRTGVILLLCGIGLLVPSFTPVFALVGGVLMNLLNVIWPMITYDFLIGRENIPRRILHGVLVTLASVLAALTVYFQVENIIELYKTPGHS